MVDGAGRHGLDDHASRKGGTSHGEFGCRPVPPHRMKAHPTWDSRAFHEHASGEEVETCAHSRKPACAAPTRKLLHVSPSRSVFMCVCVYMREYM